MHQLWYSLGCYSLRRSAWDLATASVPKRQRWRVAQVRDFSSPLWRLGLGSWLQGLSILSTTCRHSENGSSACIPLSLCLSNTCHTYIWKTGDIRMHIYIYIFIFICIPTQRGGETAWGRFSICIWHRPTTVFINGPWSQKMKAPGSPGGGSACSNYSFSSQKLGIHRAAHTLVLRL